MLLLTSGPVGSVATVLLRSRGGLRSTSYWALQSPWFRLKTEVFVSLALLCSSSRSLRYLLL